MSQIQPAADDKVMINLGFLRAQADEGVRTFLAPLLGAAAAVAAMSDPKRAGEAFKPRPLARTR